VSCEVKPELQLNSASVGLEFHFSRLDLMTSSAL